MPKSTDLILNKGMPANIDAERFVLGSILLDGSRFATVTGALIAESFAIEKHRRIWTRMSQLAERGEVIDRVTVANELARYGELESVDGLSYLVSLDEGLPHIQNIDSYVRVVSEKFRLRKIALSAQRIMNRAIVGEDSPDEISTDGQALLADQAQGYGGSIIESVSSFVETFPGGMNRFLSPHTESPGIPTGLEKIDEVTDGFHPGEIFVFGARPGHGKTAACSVIAKNVARQGHAVAVFTMELSKKMFLHRMICEEAYVSYSRFRRGDLSEEERRRVRVATQIVMDLPIYVDDTSGLRVADMWVKINRVSRDRTVGLLVTDYAQLIKAPKGQRFGTENDKFTAIGEEIKTLTKQTGIPMLLLSQLNRDSEKDKGDSRPKLSQCRGCLTADSLLWDVSTGCLKAIIDIRRGDIVVAMDEKQKLKPFEVEDQWSTGVQPVFLLSTKTGKSIKATGSHPFLTENGWKPLSEINIGEHIASSWKLPEMSGSSSEIRDDLCRLLGYFAGDGSCLDRKVATFTNTEDVLVRDCAEIGSKYFPGVQVNLEAFCRDHKPWMEIDFVTDKGPGYGGTNDLRNWFRLVGTYDKIHNQKYVARYVFESGKSGAANFIAGYFASDGCVKFSKATDSMVIHSDSVSWQLCRDISLLLSKLGIVSRIDPPSKKNDRCQPIYRLVVVPNQSNYRLFHNLIPLRGAKKIRLDAGIAKMSAKIQKAGVFGLPKHLSLGIARATHWLWKFQHKRLQRSSALMWAERLNDNNLRMWAESDILWEEVKSISACGEEEVFDVSIPGARNFIANGIVAHNSGIWEEIAFVGGCLYREYVRKREREDLAEVMEAIFEKNRSGEVKSVPLRFQGWLMRVGNQVDTPPPQIPDAQASL